MNLGYNGSMLPDYKYPHSQISSLYHTRQPSTNYPKPLSERYPRSAVSSLYDNNSLHNLSIKSLPISRSNYQIPKKIKTWDEREEISNEIASQSQRHSLGYCSECRKLFSGKKWCRPC